MRVTGIASTLFALLLLIRAPDGVARAEEESDLPVNRRAELMIQVGHSGGMSSIAFSPAGTHVLTGAGDHAACLWEVATGKEIRRFVGHEGPVRSVAFSPDGAHILTGSYHAHLWRVETGREVRRFEGFGDWVLSVAFSPDSTHVLTGSSDGTARLWEATTGEEVCSFKGHERGVSSIAFSPEGRQVLTGCDRSARIWEVGTGSEACRFEAREDRIASVAYFRGVPHALTNSWRGISRLWDVATGREVRHFEGQGERIESATVCPDGTHALTNSWEGPSRLWDVATGKVVRRYEMPEEEFAVSFSPSARYFLTGSLDGTTRLRETETGEVVRRFQGHVDLVQSVAFAASGTHILTGSGTGTVRLWETATGQEVRQLEGHGDVVDLVAFSPDGAHVLTSSHDGTTRLWETATGKELHRREGHGKGVRAIAFCPGGPHLLTSSHDGTTRLWEMATGKEVQRFEGPGGPVRSVTFSSGGAHVLTGSQDGIVRLWETATGTEIRQFRAHDRPVVSVVSSPDDTHILTTGNLDVTARMWETATGREVQRFEGSGGATAWIRSTVFCPEGTHVLAGTRDDVAISWEASTGKEIRRFQGHGSAVNSVVFSPDGMHVVTSSDDHTTRLWETATGKELCTLVSFHDGTWAVVAPDGRFDSGDLEQIEGLHWVMPDDPMRGLSIELFMRDYYEPRLLTRLLAGEAMPSVKDQRTLNRAQPHVRIVAVEPDPAEAGTVRVTVETGSRSHTLDRPEGEVVVHSGVYDLRLFRNGQVVAWLDGDLGSNDEDARTTFEGIRAPTSAETTGIEFSAYAFNSDGVKSATAKRTYEVPGVAKPREGTAYVIAFGVDAFAEPSWNLSYAAADAELYASSVTTSLRKTEAWTRVIPVLLTSTTDADCARKEDLRAVLAALAGETVPDEAVKRIPTIAQLEEARPEDLVILALSTHGLATPDGGFLLLPSDVAGHGAPDALRASCISTDDLASWLRPVDAGEMAMIVDACQSAASVDQDGFKPGPMGSSGFGQLAWNKKMRVLAASQASEYALESRQLRHGLLTHALVREGLDTGAADAGSPADGAVTLQEWLRYGESRVPGLAEAIATGDLQATGPRGPIRRENRPTAARVVQRPALFDFSRTGERRVVLRQPGAASD